MRLFWASVLVFGLPSVTLAAPLQFHQTGRLVDALGQPVTQDTSLRVRLYDSDGDTVWDRTFNNVAIEAGYYGLVLGTDSSGITLEQATSGTDAAMSVGVSINGATDLTTQAFGAVPRAAQADAVAVATGLVGEVCPGAGALSYDLDAQALVVCTADMWTQVGTASGPLQSPLTFTTCSASGRFGPSSGDCTNAYAGNDGILNNLTVISGIQYWTTPVSGTYRIEAWGAEGGGSYGTACDGGLGGYAASDVSLAGGQMIKILVGQQGGSLDDSVIRANGISGSTDGSGGGGTFVTTDGNVPMVIAGGGGGRHATHSSCSDTTMNGGQTTYSTQGAGLVQDSSSGGGGGGLIADGTTSTHPDNGCNGGVSYTNGGAGGFANQRNAYTYYQTAEEASGGFGGGGATRFWNAGGGGGGYHGGKGWNSISSEASLSGGSSFTSGLNQGSVMGLNSGDGRVTITAL
ncbi:MAG: hypothetical protein ACJATT_002899 [Myxococcota bacterium]|jgi:hypothetical protein